MDYRKQLDEALAIAKDTKSFEFGNGVLGLAPELFRKNFGEKAALVVADNNTLQAPGEVSSGGVLPNCAVSSEPKMLPKVRSVLATSTVMVEGLGC